MIGDPKWFKRRKYTGWGITPSSKQGWMYLLTFLVIITSTLVMMHFLGIKPIYSAIVVSFMLGIMIIDTTIIMCKLNKDERESQHEAYAERNAAWTMALIVGVGILFQTVSGIVHQNISVDPFLIGAIVMAVLAKGLTNWYLKDK